MARANRINLTSALGDINRSSLLYHYARSTCEILRFPKQYQLRFLSKNWRRYDKTQVSGVGRWLIYQPLAGFLLNKKLGNIYQMKSSTVWALILLTTFLFLALQHAHHLTTPMIFHQPNNYYYRSSSTNFDRFNSKIVPWLQFDTNIRVISGIKSVKASGTTMDNCRLAEAALAKLDPDFTFWTDGSVLESGRGAHHVSREILLSILTRNNASPTISLFA